MTEQSDRYREAAEWHEKWRKSLTEYLSYSGPPADHPERKRTELAIRAHAAAVDVLSKLASGEWVLCASYPRTLNGDGVRCYPALDDEELP